MKHKVYKYSNNYEKDEQWLNEMASKGMNFISYSPLVYSFEDGKPGEYIYRIELLDKVATHPKSIAYIEFMEESGIECMDTYFRWVYFRKKATEGPFNIFSDYVSRLRHYRRVLTLLGIACFGNLIPLASNLYYWLSSDYHEVNVRVLFLSIHFILFLVLTPPFISILKRYQKLKREKTVYQ